MWVYKFPTVNKWIFTSILYAISHTGGGLICMEYEFQLSEQYNNMGVNRCTPKARTITYATVSWPPVLSN